MSWFVLLWIPFSYLLHVALHELAHCNIARRYGLRATIRVLPSIRDGRLFFGWTEVEHFGSLTTEQRAEFFVAPLVTACVWTVFFGGASLLSTGHVAVTLFLAIEGVSAAVDAANWLLGLVRNRDGSDGEEWSKAKCGVEDGRPARIVFGCFVVWIAVIACFAVRAAL
jgi:hypothetical protein